MMTYKLLISFFLAGILFHVNGQCQKSDHPSTDLIRILSLDGQKELKNLSNELISVLPSGHLPECNFFNSDRIAIHDFSKSPLPIRGNSGRGIDIINENGEILQSVKGYKYIGFLEDGYYVCYNSRYQRGYGSRKSYYRYSYNFLNESFEKVFSDRTFTFATPFSEGKAVVYEDEKLYIIDPRGHYLDSLPAHLSENFFQCKKIINDVCQVTIKIPKKNGKDFHYIEEYYDTRNRQIIRGSDGKYFGEELIFPNDIGVSYNSNEIKSWNKKGEILSAITDFDRSYFAIRDRRNSNYLIFKDTNKKLHIVDKMLKEVLVAGKSINDYEVIHMNNTILCVKEKSEGGSYLACDPQTLEVIAQSEFPILGAVHNHMVLAYKRNHDFYFKGIQKGKHANYIPEDSFWYMDYNRATQNANQVINLDAMPKDAQEFVKMAEFKSLKRLKLSQSKFESFSIDFTKLNNLEELTIRVHNKLKMLPESLKNHPTLKKLSIDFCPNISNVEQIVLSLPNLQELNLSGHELTDATIKKLKSKNKNIKISLSEDPVFEDVEIRNE